MKRVLLPFPAQGNLAGDLAARVRARVGTLDCHRFPDGESLVTVDTDLADADVAVVASLNAPDAVALPLRFAARTARELGARSVGLVAPYLAYLRQDQRFRPGQAPSAQLFAQFLESSFDWLVTVDPHLHRIAALDELFAIPATNVSSAALVASWIRTHASDALLLGPDAESAQWVSRVAQHAVVPWQVLHKRRSGDESVEIDTPLQSLPGACTPVIIDDIASTGRTLEAALAQLTGAHRARAVCVVSHAVFAPGAYERLREAGARIVSTDSIPHESNGIALGAALADAVAAHFRRMDQAHGTGGADEDFDGRGSG